MSRDPILSPLINFIVPIIFLYGLFFFADFFDGGFFAFIYAMVIFVIGLMILSIKTPYKKFLSRLRFRVISVLILGLSIIYVVAVLALITSSLSV